ncbi:MAG: hypothetical protein N2440_03715 [Actinobacteria bacterium]|nr:hypothetical protein [Actinomycetota bacterium]
MRIANLGKVFSSLTNFARKKRKYESMLTKILIVSSNREEFEEILHLLGIKGRAEVEFLSFEELRKIDEKLALIIQSADIILIYSTKPAIDAKSLAFSLYTISSLNYRYLCFIYGETSHQIAEILRKMKIANPFKIFPIESRTELLRIASDKLTSVAPLDSLPKILELGVYDGIRNRKAFETIVQLSLKFYAVYNLFPFLAISFLPDYILTISNILRIISINGRRFSTATYLVLPLLLFDFGKKGKKTESRNYLLKVLILLVSIFLSLSGLESTENEE